MKTMSIFVNHNTYSWMKYAIIKNPNNCLQYTGTTVNGIPANRTEWDKYGFYPTYDVVGEVLVINGLSVLKIDEGIFVPMDGGFEPVDEQYYLEHRGNWRALRESAAHSASHVEDYIRDRFRTKRPEAGIVLSRANYYLSVYKKQMLEHADKYHMTLREYSAEMERMKPRFVGSLQRDASVIASLARKVMEENGVEPGDNTVVAWVVGIYSEAYLTVRDEFSWPKLDSVFRESYINYTNSLYDQV
jgi:hypothetical protein